MTPNRNDRPGRDRRGLRPIGDVLTEYIDELGPSDEEFRARIRKRIRHDDLWSIGTADEQLPLWERP
jgi:hypothetical protein